MNKIMSMRMPDLEYMVMNTFDDIKDKDFFQQQEILQGKSICEISLTDPRAVVEALEKWQDKPEVSKLSRNSLFEQIVNKDEYRKYLFSSIGYSTRQYLLNCDFNFQGTIERALALSSSKALSAIIETIFAQENTFLYNEMILFDLGVIMKSSSIELHGFFSMRYKDKIQM